MKNDCPCLQTQLRYLYEPKTASRGERLALGWHLLWCAACRQQRQEVLALNRILVRHFAPTGPFPPGPPVSASAGWLRLMLIGIIGAGMLTAMLLYRDLWWHNAEAARNRLVRRPQCVSKASTPERCDEVPPPQAVEAMKKALATHSCPSHSKAP